MTVFDALLLAVVGVSIFFAAVRGAVREMATLAAIIVAALAAWALMKPLAAVAGKAQSFFVAAGAAGAVGVAVFLGGYFVLHRLMSRMKLTRRMKRYDQIGGGVFGLLRALALIGLGFLGYGYYLDETNQPDAVQNAMLLPVASSAGAFFEQFAPANRDLRAPRAQNSANAAKDGYDNVDRTGLKEIVTTVTTTERGETTPADPIADILVEGTTDDDDPEER
jgi:uncharacterized membrane protein required for colicin V production